MIPTETLHWVFLPKYLLPLFVQRSTGAGSRFLINLRPVRVPPTVAVSQHRDRLLKRGLPKPGGGYLIDSVSLVSLEATTPSSASFLVLFLAHVGKDVSSCPILPHRRRRRRHPLRLHL